MNIKFSLSGGGWIVGEKADKMYRETISAGIPACLISSMWSDRQMRGSIDISLSQISCRFSLDGCSAEEFIETQKAFMHEDYKPDEVVKPLYLAMYEVKRTVPDEDDILEAAAQ